MAERLLKLSDSKSQNLGDTKISNSLIIWTEP